MAAETVIRSMQSLSAVDKYVKPLVQFIDLKSRVISVLWSVTFIQLIPTSNMDRTAAAIDACMGFRFEHVSCVFVSFTIIKLQRWRYISTSWYWLLQTLITIVIILNLGFDSVSMVTSLCDVLLTWRTVVIKIWSVSEKVLVNRC